MQTRRDRTTIHPFLEDWQPGQVIGFAHRGYAADHGENTMGAFAAAIALGYRYLETDIRATRDGVLTAFHDESLHRTAGRDEVIAQTDWCQLRELRVGGEPIPLLADILSAWPDIRLNIDPKSDDAAQHMLEVIGQFDAWHRVCVGSFSGRRLTRLRAAAGAKLCTSMGPAEVMRLRAASWGWPARSWAANCVQIPPTRYGLSIIDQRLIDTAHRNRLPVHVWTVNSTAEMKRFLDLGIDGIMTDEAVALRDLLSQRGLWSPSLDRSQGDN